jgi:hypothetical protein
MVRFGCRVDEWEISVVITTSSRGTANVKRRQTGKTLYQGVGVGGILNAAAVISPVPVRACVCVRVCVCACVRMCDLTNVLVRVCKSACKSVCAFACVRHTVRSRVCESVCVCLRATCCEKQSCPFMLARAPVEKLGRVWGVSVCVSDACVVVVCTSTGTPYRGT